MRLGKCFQNSIRGPKIYAKGITLYDKKIKIKLRKAQKWVTVQNTVGQNQVYRWSK